MKVKMEILKKPVTNYWQWRNRASVAGRTVRKWSVAQALEMSERV